MFDRFTVEEINLCCIYNTSNRRTLIGELVTGLHGVDDSEMTEIFGNTIEKLENITDTEFAEIGFYTADEFDDEGSVGYSD